MRRVDKIAIVGPAGCGKTMYCRRKWGGDLRTMIYFDEPEPEHFDLHEGRGNYDRVVYCFLRDPPEHLHFDIIIRCVGEGFIPHDEMDTMIDGGLSGDIELARP